jgi:hypothetical protein
MDIIARLEKDLRELESDYEDKYRMLLAAKARLAKKTARKIIQAGEKARGANVVDLPSDPVARGIVIAGMRRRGEIE